MRRFLVCVALVCLAAAGASGQGGASDEATPDPPPSFVRLGDAGAEARRLLQSAEKKERAWGAYLAGLHGLKAEAPRLVELLSDPALNNGDWEQALVRQSILDALIRLDAEVPAETLLPLRQWAPDEVLILLARDPRQNRQVLLSLFNEGTPVAHWLAVGNLLASTRAPGFAARLLSELKTNADVYVYDIHGLHGYGGGCGGCGGGCSLYKAPDEYPPVSYYSLTTAGARGAVVVAPGRHAVYYARATSPRCGGGDVCGYGRRDQSRVEYVADLLGADDGELKLEASPFREVVCKEQRQCLRALAAVRDELVGAYAGAVKRLLAAELLDPAEAAELKPDITLELKDLRERTPFPLPSKLKGVKVDVLRLEPPPVEDAGEGAEPSAADPR